MFFHHSGRGLRSALTLVLCALFFLLAMGLTLLASGVYRGVAASSDQTYIQRTALSYLVNQLRRSDAADCVSITSFDGVDALRLEEDGYVTLLYCYDGQLRELYAEAGLDFAPEDGVAVLPLDSMTAYAQDGLIHLTVESGGERWSASVALRSGGGEEAAA